MFPAARLPTYLGNYGWARHVVRDTLSSAREHHPRQLAVGDMTMFRSFLSSTRVRAALMVLTTLALALAGSAGDTWG